MQINDSFWINLIRESENKNQELLNGLLSINSNLKDEIFLNNVGVYYEKIGEFARAKAFYLKALSENLLSLQIWKNFFNIQNLTGGENDLLNLIFLILQSNSFIQIYFLVILIFFIIQFLKFKKKLLNIKQLITLVSPFYLILIFMTVLNTKGFFYIANNNVSIFDGPSKIFTSEKELKKGELVFVSKANNNYLKIFYINKWSEKNWVSSKSLIKI